MESVDLAEEIQGGYSPVVIITKPPGEDQQDTTVHHCRGRSTTPIERFLENHPVLIASRSRSPILAGHDLQDVD